MRLSTIIKDLLLIFLFFFFSFQGLYSSFYRFERFSNKDGFNQNTITAITRDRYDFLWFGTPNGLIKYDGYEFVSYINDPLDNNSISNNNIQSLANDKYGNLWIGNFEGVNVYMPLYEKFVTLSFPTDFIVARIIIDPMNRIWVAGDKQIYICTIEKQENNFSFSVSENLLQNKNALSGITELCFINDSRLFIAHSGGLSTYIISKENKEKIQLLNTYSNFRGNVINTIKKVDNLFYVGTDDGLYKTVPDGQKIQVINKVKFKTSDNQIISDINILSVFRDKHSGLWVGSASHGIFLYDVKSESFDHFGYNSKDYNSISSPRINCFHQDNFDVIWIGTAQGGVNKLDLNQKQFLSYSHNPYEKFSLGGDLIMDILEDNRGRLWVSSYNGSVSRSIEPVSGVSVENLRFEQLNSRIGIEEGENITTIFQDSTGLIWLGSENSVYVYNIEKDIFRRVQLFDGQNSLNMSSCRVLYQINSGIMLIGGSELYIVNNPWSGMEAKSINLRTHNVFSGGGRASCVLKTTLGHYWIGTEEGLFQCRFSNNKFVIINNYSINANELKLSNNNVFSIHEGSDKNIWVGTFGGGLNKITLNEVGDPVTIEYYRKADILPDDAVYGILQEDADHLWISTDMGLGRLDIPLKEIDIFDVRDGLPNNNYRLSAYHKGRSGYYYFGGLNGLTVFKPKDIQKSNIISKSLIYGLSINNKRVTIADPVEGNTILNKSPFETSMITLKHNARIITFHLLAQHYSTPLKNKLAYYLEGFNEDWIYTHEGKFSITYTSLPPGEYTLRIKSSNGDGQWNDDTTNLKINILPPWYKTWWSISIFIIGIIGVFIAGFIYFVRLEKLQQRLKYEQIDKKRKDKLNQGKLQFFTNISHEFRTPLTLITSPLEKVIERNTDAENRKYLSIIQNNTQRLMSLTDQLITFRKAEQGRLQLFYSSEKLGKFIYPTTEAFEHFALQQNINFFYKVDYPNEVIVFDMDKVERVIYNLLSNSFRHTPPNGQVSVEATLLQEGDKKTVRIKVIDTGSGIPTDKQEKIFERFYQLDADKNKKGGTGIGLAYCKSLVDLMGGQISVESIPNVKTCFTILIPSGSGKDLEEQGGGESWKSFVKERIPLNVSEYEKTENVHSDDKKLHSLIIVDDEPEVRNFLYQEFHKKYNTLTAENGKDALKKIKNKEPDLIVSDVMMPEMDGFELCRQIKLQPETSHIPVILLTALEDDENNLKGLEYGADDYVSKPFSPRLLEVRIQKLIENTRKLKEYFLKNSKIPDKNIEMSGRDKIFLEQVVHAIEENLSDSGFGVEELATAIGLSPSQFYRRLKQLTGQVPNVYLRNFRLQRAAELLNSNEGYSVSEVMYQIGIESSSYFSTSFKKLHGMTPSEYLKGK